MNIQVGAGGVHIPGFLNVDVRKVKGVDIVGDAGHLPCFEDGSVENIFGNAVFEHFYVGHQIPTLLEWKRLLSATGAVIMTGIPDFRRIAELYLATASGIEGKRFDLKNVYRYTHGEPEHATYPIAGEWRANGCFAPDGWLPQLHKSIFDPGYVRDLLEECELPGVIFRYAYPGEAHALNLGFIAMRAPLAESSLAEVHRLLARIPGVDRFIDLGTVEIAVSAQPQDQLLPFARKLADRKPVRGVRQSLRRLWDVFRHFGMLVVERSRDLARDCLNKLTGEPN